MPMKQQKKLNTVSFPLGMQCLLADDLLLETGLRSTTDDILQAALKVQ